MKIITRSMSVVLSVIMLISLLAIVPLTANAETFGDYSYEVLNDGTAEIMSYNGSDNTVVVPSEIDGKAVTSIGDFAFSQNDTIKSVTIPAGVKSLGLYTFASDENLNEINLPDNAINYTLTTFKTTGYYKNKANWEDGVLYIGKHLVAGAESFSDELKVKDGTLDIGSDAFKFNKTITGVTMPDSVEIIGDSAFDRCDELKSAKLSGGLKVLGSYAFTFTGITEISIPDGVEIINYAAFEKCKALKSVKFPKNLKAVDASAFRDCESLGEAVLPDTVEKIGDLAFNSCKNLNKVKIPEVVPDFGMSVFILTPVVEDVDVLYMGKNLVEVKDTVSGTFKIKEDTKVIAGGALGGTKITDVVIPDSVEYMNHSAFSGCRELKNVTIGKGIKEIKNYTFERSDIESVKIPDSVEIIGERAFYECLYLKSVEIPASVTKIGEAAFGYESYYYVEEGEGYIGDKAIENFTISGKKSSAAETYAKENNFKFVKISESAETQPQTVTEPTTVIKTNDKKTDNKTIKKANTAKKKNTVTVKAKTKTIKLKKLKKKARTVKAITVSKAKGTVTYKLIKKGTNKKIWKYLKVSKKGALTVKSWKKAKKGTYKIIVSVTAAGNKSYKKASKSVTVKIRIK